MLKIIIKIFLLFLFIACTPMQPVTWKSRIIEHPSAPLSLSYSEYGNPNHKTLLFLHGFGENRKTWRFLVPRLMHQYYLIMVDLKGFGDSPKSDDKAYSVYDQAALVHHFIKEKNLNNVTLVGRSFGGGVALVMALMQNDALVEKKLDSLVLINSMAYKQRLPSMMRTLNQPLIGYLGIHLYSSETIANEAYRYAFYNDTLIPKKSVIYAANYMKMPLAKYAYLQTVHQLVPEDVSEIEQRYKEIALSTLILWGREDVSINVKQGYRLHKDLARSELKILPFVGHMPQEEAPQSVSQEILRFVGSL